VESQLDEAYLRIIPVQIQSGDLTIAAVKISQ